ncbi:MAG: hypothetical protein PHY02_09660 [Phycisphaerae bacterium]|nr:hypothetical protein [Phycisphaerae bacterium]
MTTALRHRDIQTQKTLFTIATGASCPDTSSEAEKKVTESGARARHCSMIYNTLLEYNGATSAELALKLWPHLDHQQVWKRMHDLVELQQVRRGEKRKCKVRKSMCSTWWIV